jgi:uncharacterized membrane protein YraQ (UPF0718 family)
LVLRALGMAFAMPWEIMWPLILGFTLSAVIEAVVSHRQMARLLPDDRPRTIAKALAIGAASSSCSYAAVAIARSLFRKGADFVAAMAFEMEPGSRTEHHHAGVPGVAIHVGGVHRGSDDGGFPSDSAQDVP